MSGSPANAKKRCKFESGACPAQQPTKKTCPPLHADRVLRLGPVEEIDACVYKISDRAPYCWPRCRNVTDRLWQIQLDAKRGKSNVLYEFEQKFNAFLADSHGAIGVDASDVQELENSADMRLVETDEKDPDSAGLADTLTEWDQCVRSDC